MKTINTYINEKLRLTSKRTYTCQPKDKDELRKIIIDRIKKEGNECDLNDIDVSKITDMSRLFDAIPLSVGGNPVFQNFNGDISMWNVSNVHNMHYMFRRCYKFNCDLSMWDVSNVEDMGEMFNECYEFDYDISGWDVSNVENMRCMFEQCHSFDCNLSRWNVSKVEDIGWMFWNCEKFNQNLDSWDVSNVIEMHYTFKNCPTKPTWYDRKRCE
jgi:surface protein